MRAIICPVAVAVVLGAAVPANSAAATCTPEGYKVVKRSRVAVVVQDPQTAEFYACAFSRNVLRPLDPHGIGPDLEIGGELDFRMRGRFVAFYERICDGNDCEPSLGVINAETGRVRDANTVAGCGPDFACQDFSDFVVSARGALAWIQTHADGGGIRRVVRCDVTCMTKHRGLKGKVLDRGRRIRATSLAVRGAAITWLHAGARRRAPFR